MQVPTWDNPVGTNGFEFIEYTAPDPKALGKLFEQLGFTAIARHRHKDVTLYRQGDINFIVNAEPDSFAQRFAQRAGDPTTRLPGWFGHPVGQRDKPSRAARTEPFVDQLQHIGLEQGCGHQGPGIHHEVAVLETSGHSRQDQIDIAVQA